MKQYTDVSATVGANQQPTWTFGEAALTLRKHLYAEFLTHGRCSNVEHLINETGLTRHEVRDALLELERGVMVMIERDTDGVIVKCPPWANIPTPHVIEIDSVQRGYAGCGLEALNACFAYPAENVTIRTSCPHCAAPITLPFEGFDLSGYEPRETVLHIGINPLDWPNNWVEACANTNFFVNADHVRAWEREFPQYTGVTLPMDTLDGLPRYTNRLDYDRGPDNGKTVGLLAWVRERAAVPVEWG